MSTLAEVLAHGYGIERTFTCPVHGDTNPSASVNTLKMVWVCYACGAHGKVGGEVLAQDLDIQAARKALLKRLRTTEPKPESWLNLYDSEDPYWLTRFSRETVKHYRLGHDYELGAATYPLRDNQGRVLGVVRRPLGGDDSRKYVYPWGVDISNYLFDFHRLDSDVLVLTEGATDAMAGWETQLRVGCSAIYGRRLSEAQALLIRQHDPRVIICAFDNDAAGYGAYNEVLGKLSEYPIMKLGFPGHDLAGLTVEVRRNILTHCLDLYHSKA